MASPPDSAGKEVADRFQRLRKAAGFRTSKDLAAAARTLAEQSSGEYELLGETNARNLESRGVPQKDRLRATLAKLFNLTRDDLARYLNGDISLEEALELRKAGERASAPPPSMARPPMGPLLRTHPEWADLCARALAEDPDIKPETLRAVGEKPFVYGSLDEVDVALVVTLARGLQSWRRRRGT